MLLKLPNVLTESGAAIDRSSSSSVRHGTSDVGEVVEVPVTGYFESEDARIDSLRSAEVPVVAISFRSRMSSLLLCFVTVDDLFDSPLPSLTIGVQRFLLADFSMMSSMQTCPLFVELRK